MKRVIVSVTNDLSTDQRVNRTSNTLMKLGFDVTLIGRKLSSSQAITGRAYKTKRMRLVFNKGPLFYAEYNIRLFFFILFHKYDLLVSNDLDTLLANYLNHKIKKIPIVYDSHEYYTETPELVNRPRVQKIWERIEKSIFPKLKDVITVNKSIAGLYKKKYGLDLKVVRNIPASKSFNSGDYLNLKTKSELSIPTDKKIVILQGAGINIQRGAEEAVEAMQYLNGVVLFIIGGGDVIDILKEKTETLNLKDKIIFIPKIPAEELFNYTKLADIGLTIDKDTNINYRYSLPNKLFDYIEAGTPILASKLVEIKNIIEKYDIGDFIDSHEPEHIAQKIMSMLEDKARYKKWKENLKFASKDLCWENEEKILIDIYKKYV